MSNPLVKPLKPIGRVSIEDAKQWIDDHTYRTHPLWLNGYSNDRKGELYDQGMQWLTPTQVGWSSGLVNWINTYYDPSDANYTPTPVLNKGFSARVNETARLGRPNYKPVVIPTGESVTYPMRKNAQNATRALQHRMKEMEWDKLSNLLYYHMPVYGGAWIKSEWVYRWDKTAPVPSPSSASCTNEFCDFKVGSTTVPSKVLQGRGLEATNTTTSVSPYAVKLNACPQCEDHPPLKPYQMSMEEAAVGKDSLGLPMGRLEPVGDWEVSIRSPYDVMPRDLGFGMEPGKVNEWVEQHIQSVDWCYLRYANAKDIKELKPEAPTELAKYHPMLGTPDIYGSIIDTKVLRDSLRVKEYHREPWLEMVTDEETGQKHLQFNQGRSLVIASNVLLYDGPFLLKSSSQPGKTVGRVMMDYIPWELRDGGRRLDGMSLWELMFDSQDAFNETTAQTQSVRQRMALPLYVGLKSWQMQIATRNGVPGRWAFIDVDPESPTFKPEVINNMTIDEGVRAEQQFYGQMMDELANFAQVEKGDVPPNVGAALAIQYLKTFASEGREPRLARIRASLQRVWEHGLELMKAFYIEPREIEYEGDDKEPRSTMVDWQQIEVDGTIKVEAEADFDDKARNQQLVIENLQTGLIDLKDQGVAREVARILEMPEELYKKQDIQRRTAEKEYLYFRDEGTVPVRDPSVDDDQTHYDQHGIDSQSDWFLEQERLGDWDNALKILGPFWDKSVQEAGMMTVGNPGNPMMGIPPSFPTPPCLQEKLVDVWTQILLTNGYQVPGAPPQQPQLDPMTGKLVPPPPPELPEELVKVMQWKAHNAEHKFYGELGQMQAQAAPVLAAPGSAEETESGNVPTPSTPPEEPVGMVQ